MDMKFKKVLTELLSEGYISWDEKRAFIKSQTLLGHAIIDTYSNEIDSMNQKELGFILDNDCKIVIDGFTDFNEKANKWVLGNYGDIIYDHLDSWGNDEDVHKANSFDPYAKTAEAFEEAKAKAIFPNRKELNKFIKLLKYMDEIQFKTTFDKVITGEDSFGLGVNKINIENYKNFTFDYHYKTYAYDKGEAKFDDWGGSAYITFKSNDEDMWSQESISFHMFFKLNAMGKLEGKPNISISHRYGGFSDFKDIKTDVLDGLIKDILKQLK